MGRIIDRRRVCGGKKGLLPSGYTQVEYIESTGIQYIDTGIIIGSSPYEIFVDFQATSLVNFESVYGARISSTSQRLDNWFGANGSGGYGLNGTSARALTLFSQNRTTLLATRTSVLKNGISDVNRYYNRSDIQYSIYLFATNTANTATNFLIGKIYRATIKKDNILSFDGIPCINPNNIVGVYDTVNGVFYSSPNGVAFIAGPVV